MESKFHFIYLDSKKFNIQLNKYALDYFLKWSIKGQLKLATFCFNELFQIHQKEDFIQSFFNDTMVISTLNKLMPTWFFEKGKIEKINMEVVPCTVSTMAFFDRILDEENQIVRGEGNIRHCLEDIVDGFLVADQLRKMLIDQESDNYGLYLEKDRNELIFRIFQFLVLGGKWCQYEDKVKPYLELTKMLYKDLVRVERNVESKKVEIKNVCVKVVLIGKNKGRSIFPVNADNIQNFAYLIIDPTLRQITVFLHEHGGQF